MDSIQMKNKRLRVFSDFWNFRNVDVYFVVIYCNNLTKFNTEDFCMRKTGIVLLRIVYYNLNHKYLYW